MGEGRLLWPGPTDYDATTSRFLPVISILPALLTLLCTVGQGPDEAAPAQAPAQAEAKVVGEIVVGSGEVRAEILAAVRSFVDAGLATLRPVFRDLEPKPFWVFVHASAESLPVSLAEMRHARAPGFALLGRHQIHLVIGDVRRSGSRLQSVVVHELVHELLDQFAAPHGAEIPRWFHEGLAQHLAGDTYLGAREQDLVWRIGVRRLLAFGDLRTGFPRDDDELRVAYGQSYSYVSYLVREHGLYELIQVVANTDGDISFDRALVGRLRKTTLELYDAWTNYLRFGSGAWWRVALEQCFNALLILALPALGVAWWRRRRRARKIGDRMERQQAMFPQQFDLERPESADPDLAQPEVADGDRTDDESEPPSS